MTRSVPLPSAESAPFWEAAARGELIYQRCSHCGAIQTYPRHRCGICHATELDWRTSGRRGRIQSFTIVHRAPSEAFKGMTPYVLALVDLDEGFRLMLNLPDDDPARVAIGARVRIVFETLDGGALPQGRLA